MSFSSVLVKERKTRERISATFQMSLNGTKRTFADRASMSAFGGKADMAHCALPDDGPSVARCRLMTRPSAAVTASAISDRRGEDHASRPIC